MEKTVVELFAGVGGFHLGLSKADPSYKVIWANQWEPGKNVQHAFDCYKSHFEKKGTICVNEDIAKVKNEIPKHSLLVGGFPCQDYSVSTTGAKGISGKKGVLWWEINDILKENKPPFVLLENVDRLIKSPAKQRGRDFAVMLSCFQALDYTVEWRVINAADYGFAQRRRRVFIYAYKNNTKFGKKQSKFKLEDIIRDKGMFASTFKVEQDFKYKTLEIDGSDLQGISDNFSFNFDNSGILRGNEVVTAKTEPVYKTPTLLRDIVQSNVDIDEYQIKNEEKWRYLKGSKNEPRTSSTGFEYKYTEGPVIFPDPLDRPGRTMLTSEASINRSSHAIEDLDTGVIRVLTEIEAERLNGFDDDWTNIGMPKRMRYFCMGNALVVGLIEEMGKTISKIIESEK